MIIDHGTFSLYTPELPDDHPLHGTTTLFLKNGDGKDWYSIAHADPAPGRSFVVVSGDRVSSLSPDPSTLWPIDGLLIETDDPVDRGWFWTGQSFVDPATIPPDLNEIKAELLANIDSTAESIRLQFITPGSGQALAYDRKRREAAAALLDPQPTPEKYPLLAASIGIEVLDTGDAKTDFDAIATLVMTMEQQWAGVAHHIEAKRLGGKRAIEAADTVEAAQQAFDAIDWTIPQDGLTPAGFSMPSAAPRYTVSELPAGILGQMSFATDGRKSGEDAGQGTGVLVFHDGMGWKTSDTGAAVAA